MASSFTRPAITDVSVSVFMESKTGGLVTGGGGGAVVVVVAVNVPATCWCISGTDLQMFPCFDILHCVWTHCEVCVV